MPIDFHVPSNKPEKIQRILERTHYWNKTQLKKMKDKQLFAIFCRAMEGKFKVGGERVMVR